MERDANLGSRARIALETDAVDDYFIRDMDHGECAVLAVRGDGAVQIRNWTLHGQQSGVVNLVLELPDSAVAGDTLVFEIRVSDPSRVEGFTNRLRLRIRPAVQHSPGGNGTGHRHGGRRSRR